MSASLSIPLSIPLSEERNQLLARLTDGLDVAALHWLSGYAAGLATQQLRGARPLQAVPVQAEVDAGNASRLSIVYGSQTGNARRVAEQLAQAVQADGLAVRLLRADAYPLRELTTEHVLYIVISTQGDGDPPDDAQALVEFLASRRAPALKELRYAVLGLGDSSYPKFNAVSQALDTRLAELGAQRLFAAGAADLDIDPVVVPWRTQALASARELLKIGPTPVTVSTPKVTALRPAPSAPTWTREKPYAAELLDNQRITGRDSAQDVRHLEFSLAGSGLSYEPGDALGVWPRNDPALVDSLLATLELDGETQVRQGEEVLPLRAWLGERRELTRLGRPFVASHAALAGNAALDRLFAAENGDALSQLLSTHQLPDLLHAYPAAWRADELVAALRPLAPRLYSIASSSKHVGEEVHLAVAVLEYRNAEAKRRGVASGYLGDCEAGARVPVFIERNERFRLPVDPARDVLMIGPGTGVAPFRGFVQERAVIGAAGRNWLLFGARHARSQFLYQLEWQAALKDGILHRLDLAFSRDIGASPAVADTQPDTTAAALNPHRRVYVQQRLREQGREVFDWLQNGAHVYVCGAIAMGKDVHAALLEIIAEHGAFDRDAAVDYLRGLQQAGRYSRDLY